MPITLGRRPDHIFDEPLGLLSDCHRRIEHFLRVLNAIAGEAGEGPLPPARRSEPDTALTYFMVAAPAHTADEEESLFPRLRAAAGPAETVTRLLHDHEEASAHHAAVEAIGRRWLAAGTLGPEARRTLRGHLAALDLIY